MEEQWKKKKPTKLRLHHRKVWRPFQCCNRRLFWPQMENTMCCYRSAASLCTQAVYDHPLAGRLKLIRSTAVPHRTLALQCFTWPQLLGCPCTSLGPSQRPQQSFLTHSWKLTKTGASGTVP